MLSTAHIITFALLAALSSGTIVRSANGANGLKQLPLLDISSRMETEIDMMGDLAMTSPETTPSPSSSRTPAFVFRNSTVGFARLSGAGVAVTRGASASLNFDFSLTALDAAALQANSSLFRQRLTSEENVSYGELVRNYSGGLDMPFMVTIGANLEMNVTRDDLIESSMTQDNYNRKANAARDILTANPPGKVDVTGSIMVSGNSIIPREIFAFIKVARVALNDGTTVVVVSSDPNDVEAATFEGFTTDSTTPEDLDVAPATS